MTESRLIGRIEGELLLEKSGCVSAEDACRHIRGLIAEYDVAKQQDELERMLSLSVEGVSK